MPLSWRFLVLLGVFVLAAGVAWAAAVLHSATWTEARQLDDIFPFYTWRIRPFSAADYAQLRGGLAWAAVALYGAGAALLATAAGRAEAVALGREVRGAAASLRAAYQGLTPTQRRHAAWGLAALTALRLYFSLTNPEYDDAVSYEVFVSKGLLATSSYYPIPNNHVFSNTISWLFYQVSPGFWWSMRLPVLLLCTLATIGWLAGLTRWVGFRVAAVAVGLFSGLQLSLYHAGVGRGYWLLIGLAGMCFFAMLELLRPGGRHRAAWAAMAIAGALGCYTVPTFAYVLVSAFSWLGVAWLRRHHWAGLGRAVAVGAVVVGTAVALYAPLLLVSGIEKFTGNGFVAPLPPQAFWQGLPGYVWHTEGFLAGQRTLGALLTLSVLALVAGLFWLKRQGHLPRVHCQRLQRVGQPALWFMALPYVVLPAQRVFPPERVMLYKSVFFFLLLGLVLDWALTRWPVQGARRLRLALLVAGLLFLSYETYSVVRVNPTARSTNGTYRAGVDWLAAHPAGPVLIPEPTHNLFFRFYAHPQQRQRRWQFDYVQRPASRYAYVVAFPNKRGYFQPEFPFPPAYRNAEVEIYAVPAGFAFNSAGWLH